MNAEINQLLLYLSKEEAAQVPVAIRKLMRNEDFQLLFRHLNQSCGGVLAASFDISNDPIKAAAADGAKGPARFIFDTWIKSFGEKKKKPTEQDTSPV